MALKGRHWVMFWLVAFLGAAGAVVARQTAAIRTADALREIRTRHAALAGRRADLERRIRAAESRAVLVPRAQRLGLRLAADTEIILLQVRDSGVP